MSSSRDIRRYRSLTDDLRQSYPWLGDLGDEGILNKDVTATFQRWRAEHDKFVYDSQRFEDHLADVSRLLDRVLGYRREYNDLAGAAVRQALEYDLFRKQRTALEALDAAVWLKDLRVLDAQGQQNTAVAFRIDAGAPLSAGFVAASMASQDVSAQAALAEQSRINLVATRWKAFEEYQANLELRHTTPGHPLNFSERAGRIKPLLLDDVFEATAKIFAAAQGIKNVLDVDFGAVHDLNLRTATIDDFVWFTRDLIQQVELATQFEQTTEWLVPGHVDAAGDWGFRLYQNYFSKARIKAVGLSFSLNNITGIPDPAGLRLSAVLPIAPNLEISLTGALLGPNVSQFFHSGWEVNNLPLPFQGGAVNWTLKYVFMYQPVTVPAFDFKNLDELHLHVLVVGKRAPAAAALRRRLALQKRLDKFFGIRLTSQPKRRRSKKG